MDLRDLLDQPLQLRSRSLIIKPSVQIVAAWSRQLALNLTHHDHHGLAQPGLIIPVIPVDKEDDRGHPDHDKRKQTDKDDRRMDLRPDIHLPVGLELAPVQPRPDQQRSAAEQRYEEQKSAEQISKQRNILDR